MTATGNPRFTALVSSDRRRWTVVITELGLSGRARGVWEVRTVARALITASLGISPDSDAFDVDYRFIDTLDGINS